MKDKKYNNIQRLVNKIKKYRDVNNENIENIKKLALKLFIECKSLEWRNKNEKTINNI